MRLCLFAASSVILGGWLFAIPLYSAEDCAPPPPPLSKKKIKDGKIARFGLRAAQSLISGEWEFVVSFFPPLES